MKRILSNLNIGAAVVLAFVLVQMVNYIALRNPLRWDWSSGQRYALSQKTIDLLESLDRRVDVTVFFQEDSELYPEVENLLEEYQYRSQDIHVDWVDPTRNIAKTERLAKKFGITEPQVVVFSIGGKSEVIHKADLADFKMVRGRKEPVLSAFKGEQAFSSAIQALLQGKTPVVYFLVGHGEGRVTDYDPVSGFSKIGQIIAHDNIELRELSLTKEKRVPENAAAVVVLGPTKPLDRMEVGLLDDYLSKSGRIMLLLDALRETGLDDMLRRWGVGLRKDFVLDPLNTLKGSDVYVRNYYEHPITLRMQGAGARFLFPRSVEPLALDNPDSEDRPEVSRLAVTSKKGWSETQVDETSAKYDEGTGDRRGPICMAVAVERGANKQALDVQISPSRMVVFGDSDFVSNGALSGGDQDLFMSALNWLIDRETLMAIAPKPLKELKLDLTHRQLNRLFWLNVVGIPLVAVVLGLLVWLRRRK